MYIKFIKNQTYTVISLIISVVKKPFLLQSIKNSFVAKWLESGKYNYKI